MVPKRQLDEARAEFKRQAQAFDASPAVDENGDEVEAIDICVVVARNVTRDMLDRTPSAWTSDLVLALRADGMLELMDVEMDEHRLARVMMVSDLGHYVVQHLGYTVWGEILETFNGIVYKPAGILIHNGPNRNNEPILVVEAEICHRTVKGLIEIAQNYLQDPRVLCVVGCIIFRARKAALDMLELKKAALAVVLERVPMPAPLVHGPHPICIVHEVSRLEMHRFLARSTHPHTSRSYSQCDESDSTSGGAYSTIIE